MKPRNPATTLPPVRIALLVMLASSLAACIYHDESSHGTAVGDWPSACDPTHPDDPCFPCWFDEDTGDQNEGDDGPPTASDQPGEGSDSSIPGDNGDGNTPPGSGGSGSPGDGNTPPDDESDPPCLWTMDCPQGVCVDGKCLVECGHDDECGAGRACFAGMCEAAELPGPECTRTTDCAGDATCIDGQCRPPCSCDGDCLDNERCAFGGCLPLNPNH